MSQKNRPSSTASVQSVDPFAYPVPFVRPHGVQSGLNRARNNAAVLNRVDSRLGLLRLALAATLLAVLVALVPRLTPLQDTLLIVFALGLFVLVSHLHQRLQRQGVRWKNLASSYESEMHRDARDFTQINACLAPWVQPNIQNALQKGHLYASDLDLPNLLLPLIDTCVTPEASRALSELVLNCEKETESSREKRSLRIRAIQAHTTLLRELDATRFSEESKSDFAQGRLCRFDELEVLLHAETNAKRKIWYVSFGLLSIGAWLFLLLPAHYQFFVSGDTEAFLRQLLRYVLVPLVGLGVYRSLVSTGLIAKRRLQGLKILMKDIEVLGHSASLQDLALTVRLAKKNLTHLELVLDLIQARTNPVFWLFVHALLPFDSLLCLRAHVLIARLSKDFKRLIGGLTEFDVDAALARFANENPEFVYSQFQKNTLHVSTGSESTSQDATSQALLLAKAMGHPLIPRTLRVNNSIVWEKSDGLVLLTGSNMSGKSTFIRTLGLNCVLHNIGAPVCAEELRAPVVSLLCAIRVDDSVEQGISYFYAEVKRLARILKDLQQDLDAGSVLHGSDGSLLHLYLVDEIFRGTNNRERFLGSLYVIRSFMAATSGIGIVTTHDLALTAFAHEQTAQLRSMRNMHFRESVKENVLCFDYVLRAGPCPTTNALRIMHAEGLPVPAEVSEEDEMKLRTSLSHA